MGILSCVLVGNGPSLSLADLDLIHAAGARSIAVNRIRAAPKKQSRGLFELTSWRPTAYVISDKNWNSDAYDDARFAMGQGYPCFIRADIIRDHYVPVTATPLPGHVVMIEGCAHDYIGAGPPTEWHKDGSLCWFGGSLHYAFQVAALLWKCRRIALIGVDQGPGHFYPTTFDPDPIWLQATRNRAFQVAYAECLERGIEVINCTPAGRLKLFPRLSLEEFLNG